MILILLFLTALIDTGIIVVSFFRDDSRKSVGIGLVCTIILVGLSSFTAAFYSLSGDCDTCSFFFPATEAFYTYTIFFLFYSLCLTLSFTPKSPIKPRSTLRLWLWYLFSVYTIAMVGSGILYFGERDIGFCVMDIVIIWYSVFYAPFLFITISNDSDYLSEIYDTTPITPVYSV